MRLIDADALNIYNISPADGFSVMGVTEEDIMLAPTIEPQVLACGQGETVSEPWIPVTERLPEEHEWVGTKMFGTTISDEVYVTFEAPDGQRFIDHICFQNGKLSASDAERMRVWFKGAKPIAWMPLPEPYQGGERE